MSEPSRTAPDLGEWILAFLRVRSAKDHRIVREALIHACRTAGFELPSTEDAADRVVRRAIEEMRRSHPDGPYIVAFSDEPGSFFSTDPEELERANAEDLSRMESTREKFENRRRAIDRLRLSPLEQGRLFGG